MWEDVIVPTITSMGVGAWYADPANATANAHTFSAPYSHTVAFNSDDDIVYALGQAGVNVSITVGTVRDTPKPRITFVHVSGQIADLYDFKTDGSDNHLGWAGRVQTCYAPSCSRTAGKVFNLLVNTSVSASTIDERPQHDAWGELRPLWIAAVANRP